MSPSHVGTLLTCSHALHVQVQLESWLAAARAPVSLRVPLRVLPARGAGPPTTAYSAHAYDAAAAHAQPALAAHTLPRFPGSTAAPAPQVGATSGTTAHSFVIAKGAHRVGVWRLERTHLTAGDTLRALFETHDATLTCYALSAVILQLEEPLLNPATASAAAIATHTQLVSETHVAMQHSRTRALTLPLPRELTPSLEDTAHALRVRYVLRVRFVVAAFAHDRRGEARVEDAAMAVPLEQLEWEVPLTVRAPATHAIELPPLPPALGAAPQPPPQHDSARSLAPWHSTRLRGS